MTNYETLLVGILSGLVGVVVGSFSTYFFNKKYFHFSLITESKFKLYSFLWKDLSNLKKQGKILWRDASSINLRSFSKVFFKLEDSIENNRLILDEEDYYELKKIIKKFKEFKIGKKILIQRRQQTDISPEDIYGLINTNSKYKEQYEDLMKNILIKFKRRIN